MTTHFDTQTKVMLPIPHWLVLTLCWLFALLYGVWILPETVFIRHFCLVAGAILSLYVIYPNRRLLLTKEAIPIWLIGLLILWVTFHVFFIGHDFERQWEEYTRIWKKIAIGSVFAIGLGLGVSSQIKNEKNIEQYWKVIYLGFFSPALIYFIKLAFTHLSINYGLPISPYLILESNWNLRFGIARSLYVFFCLPALAIGLGSFISRLNAGNFISPLCVLYLISIPLILLIFSYEGDRLGSAYGLALMLTAVIRVLYLSLHKKRYFLYVFGSIALLVAGILILQRTTYDHSSWHSLWVDAKVAVQVDRYDGWKTRVMPLNELGNSVNASNYERISWVIVGTHLLAEHPMGYGLLSLSFGALGKQIWSAADLSWTHSAWLDFALGYGVPGLFLFWAAIFMAWIGSMATKDPWRSIGVWGLPTAAAVLFTKEVATEVVVNAMVFLVAWVAAMNLRASK